MPCLILVLIALAILCGAVFAAKVALALMAALVIVFVAVCIIGIVVSVKRY